MSGRKLSRALDDSHALSKELLSVFINFHLDQQKFKVLLLVWNLIPMGSHQSTLLLSQTVLSTILAPKIMASNLHVLSSTLVCSQRV